jgi:hypothetical protein
MFKEQKTVTCQVVTLSSYIWFVVTQSHDDGYVLCEMVW